MNLRQDLGKRAVGFRRELVQESCDQARKVLGRFLHNRLINLTTDTRESLQLTTARLTCRGHCLNSYPCRLGEFPLLSAESFRCVFQRFKKLRENGPDGIEVGCLLRKRGHLSECRVVDWSLGMNLDTRSLYICQQGTTPPVALGR